MTEKKLLEYQMLEGNIRTLRAQLSEATERLNELARAKAALEELRTVKAGQHALIPMGAGNFVRGEVRDCSSIFVSIGGDVVLRRDRAQAIKLLDDRISELEKVISELSVHERALVGRLQKLYSEIKG